jgi:hypothetical protein
MGVDIAKAALAAVADPNEETDAYRDPSASLALDEPQHDKNRK